MKKVEIIKIPYKPFRKKLYGLFEDSQGNHLLALLKDLGSVLKEQGLYSSKILGFPLLCFQKKVVAIRKG